MKKLTIVTPSHWLANLVKESFLTEYPVEVIHNGIDLEIFKPTPSNFKERYHCDDKTVVLGVANVWDRRKGLNTFIELSKELPDDFQIVLVGLSKKQMKLLPDNIIKIQRTNSTKELAEIYTAANVFVNPTLEDNFPTTNLESLACGTPVITYNTGGSPECVINLNGLIIEQNNTDELINKIKTNKNIKNKEKLFEKVKNFEKNIKFRDYLTIYSNGVKIQK